MKELYQFIEEKIQKAGYPKPMDGEKVYKIVDR